jgi:GR25 family glycosyltransferase involved in LPS biosynthesis
MSAVWPAATRAALQYDCVRNDPAFARMLATLRQLLPDLLRPRRQARRAPAQLVHYWINPDDAAERGEWMRQQLDAIGVRHARVRACTPGDLPDMALPGAHDLTPLQLACLASQLKTLDQALADGGEMFVVVEDDMTLPFDVDFGRLVASAPRDWDILQLYVVNAERLRAMYARSYRRARLWRRWHPKHHSTGAYLCSREGAQKVLARVKRGGAIDLSRYRGLLVADDLIYRCARTYTATYPLYVENADFGSTLNSLARLHVATHAAIRDIWRAGDPPSFARLRS